MIISRTPFRISFFGGGTDYPSWYRKHGGAVLATTIDKYCYLTCRYLPPFFEHKYRLVYSRIENALEAGQIQHPVVREVLRYLEIDRGVEIHHDGDLPARSGMGSSSAFTVGLLNALYALKGEMPDKHRLAREAIHVEQHLVKETIGSQDQVLAAYGGFNHVTFLPDGDVSVRPVTVAPARVKELNAHLMLFYTGFARTASVVADSYVHDIESRKRQLRLVRDLVDESLSILTGGGSLHGFGELLHEAWEAKRSLSSRVSSTEIDHIYSEAKAAGALGGKLTGAGGGGFMLLFAPPEHQANIRRRLQHLLCVPFTCGSAGSQIIFYDPEPDYATDDLGPGAGAIPSLRAVTDRTA